MEPIPQPAGARGTYETDDSSSRDQRTRISQRFPIGRVCGEGLLVSTIRARRFEPYRSHGDKPVLFSSGPAPLRPGVTPTASPFSFVFFFIRSSCLSDQIVRRPSSYIFPCILPYLSYCVRHGCFPEALGLAVLSSVPRTAVSHPGPDERLASCCLERMIVVG